MVRLDAIPLIITLAPRPAAAEAPGPPDAAAGASVRAGGGYDLNVDAAPELAKARSAPTWNTGASIDGSLRWGRTRAGLLLSWDLVDLPTLPELRTHSLQARPTVQLPVAWHLDASLGPSAGLQLVAEEARSAWEVGGFGRLDWRARPWLRTNLGYRFVHHDAQEDVYDRDRHRVALGAEATVARRTRLRLDLAVEAGEVVLYEEITATTDGAGEARTTAATAAKTDGGTDGGTDGTGSGSGTMDRTSTPTTAFGTDLLAWSTPAVTSSAVLGLAQGLGAHVDLALALGFVDGRYDGGAWQAPFGHLGLSLYLP